jgi:hypothetical protein
MDVPEKWGHRADATVACLMAACALVVAIYGVTYTYQSCVLRPYLLIFLCLELLWFGWIIHSLVMLARSGHFSPAAWHVAIAIPMASMGILSLLIWVPNSEPTFHSQLISERLIEHILLSLRWWIQQN